MSMRQALLVAAALAAVPLSASTATAATAKAATVENFQVRTAADLVALCDARPGADNYVAAVNFCQGFGVGAFQYYQAQAADDPTSQFVCVPNPAPTRDAVIASFVAWAKAHPQYLSAAAVDTMFRYLGETYPCRR